MPFPHDARHFVREALEALIGQAGWRAEVFVSAHELFERFASRTPSPGCLVLDVGLPDLNGLELQKHMADKQLTMPIVFITGCGDIPMTAQAMKTGAHDFLTKPFAQDVLLSAIGTALQRSRLSLETQAKQQALREIQEMAAPPHRA